MSVVSRLSFALGWALLATLTTGCGKANVKLKLNQGSSSALTASSHLGAETSASTFTPYPDNATPVTATVFQMKIIQAYLVEDVDPSTSDNVGKVSRMWVNSGCPSENGCRDSDVGFFDLADPTAANAELNSQSRSVDSGTYRYVRIEFCVGGPSGPNVKYKTADMAAETTATYSGCGQTSAALAAPLELKKGDSVTIALDYNLAVGPLYTIAGSTCTTAAPCLGGINLSPRIVQ